MTDNSRLLSITEPSVLLPIHRTYRTSMTPIELYDATRGIWGVRLERAQKAQLAFTLFHGEVKEVYEITAWLPAGSTFTSSRKYAMRNQSDLQYGSLENKVSTDGKYEFVGLIARSELRNKYLNQSITHISKTTQHFAYINISE